MNPTLAALNQAAGFNKLCQARDGLFLANTHDVYVGRALLTYGEYNYHEAAVLNQIVAEGDIVIEVGANIGSHTVGIARRAGPQGRVIAFEPQPVVFQTLCANIALNSLVNVECYPAAVGACAGWVRVPFIRYDVEGNFGGVSLGGFTEGMDVAVVRLDDVFKYNRLKLIKIDVEGMESDVIDGARSVIEKFKPALYVENDRIEKSEALIQLIKGLGYRLWWDLPPLFNPQNFAGNLNNIFGDVVSINMLCVPAAATVNIDRPEILNPSEHPLRRPG